LGITDGVRSGFADFHVHMAWWEGAILIRRLIINLVPAVTTVPSEQMGFAVLVQLAFLLAVSVLRPYANTTDRFVHLPRSLRWLVLDFNKLEAASLAVSAFSQIVTWLTTTDGSSTQAIGGPLNMRTTRDGRDLFMTISLAALSTAFLVLALFTAAYRVWSGLNHKLALENTLSWAERMQLRVLALFCCCNQPAALRTHLQANPLCTCCPHQPCSCCVRNPCYCCRPLRAEGEAAARPAAAGGGVATPAAAVEGVMSGTANPLASPPAASATRSLAGSLSGVAASAYAASPVVARRNPLHGV